MPLHGMHYPVAPSLHARKFVGVLVCYQPECTGYALFRHDSLQAWIGVADEGWQDPNAKPRSDQAILGIYA